MRRLDAVFEQSQARQEGYYASEKSIDCRDYPSEKHCSLKISGTEEEVLDAAVQHAASVHGHENTSELREQIKSMLKDEPG
jgi:predicted small metal-binding protein